MLFSTLILVGNDICHFLCVYVCIHWISHNPDQWLLPSRQRLMKFNQEDTISLRSILGVADSLPSSSSRVCVWVLYWIAREYICVFLNATNYSNPSGHTRKPIYDSIILVLVLCWDKDKLASLCRELCQAYCRCLARRVRRTVSLVFVLSNIIGWRRKEDVGRTLAPAAAASAEPFLTSHKKGGHT